MSFVFKFYRAAVFRVVLEKRIACRQRLADLFNLDRNGINAVVIAYKFIVAYGFADKVFINAFVSVGKLCESKFAVGIALYGFQNLAVFIGKQKFKALAAFIVKVFDTLENDLRFGNDRVDNVKSVVYGGISVDILLRNGIFYFGAVCAVFGKIVKSKAPAVLFGNGNGLNGFAVREQIDSYAFGAEIFAVVIVIPDLRARNIDRGIVVKSDLAVVSGSVLFDSNLGKKLVVRFGYVNGNVKFAFIKNSVINDRIAYFADGKLIFSDLCKADAAEIESAVLEIPCRSEYLAVAL